MEFIRFSLLIIITIAGISIGVRHDNSPHSASRAAGSGTPSASAPTPATTGGSSGAGGSSGSGNAGSGNTGNHGEGGSGSAAAGQGNGGVIGADGGGTTATTPALPRTGTQAAELGGLAALMIAGGSFSVMVSRRPSR